LEGRERLGKRRDTAGKGKGGEEDEGLRYLYFCQEKLLEVGFFLKMMMFKFNQNSREFLSKEPIEFYFNVNSEGRGLGSLI